MKILIIQILRMGDALQLVPVIKSIKSRFPESRIHLLTSKLGAEVFHHLAEVESVFILSKEQLVTGIKAGKKEDLVSALETLEAELAPIYKHRWDWVINFSYTFSSALLSYMLDAKHRSGFTANKHRQFISKDKWSPFSLASFMNRKYSNFNWVDIYKQSIGLRSLPEGPYLFPDAGRCSPVAEVIRGIKGSGHRVIGMHPGAGGGFKQWPTEKFGHLGRMLAEQDGTRLLVFGGREEGQQGEYLKSLIGEKATNLSGQTSFEDLATALSACDLLISNDTGPMHLASTVGTRVIALFFTTHYVETGPYGAGHIVIHPDIACFPCQGTAACRNKRCLDLISPNDVNTVVSASDPRSNPRGLESYEGLSTSVRIYQSTFDSWRNLVWQPIGRPGLDATTLERFLLKTAWLTHSDVIDSSDSSLASHIRTTLRSYDLAATNGTIQPFLSELSEKLDQFAKLLEKGKRFVFELQSEFIKGGGDRAAVDRLSRSFSETESDILSFGRDSAFSFLHELLTSMLQNIEKTDRISLSTRTAEVYRDLAFIVNTMKRHLILVEAGL